MTAEALAGLVGVGISFIVALIKRFWKKEVPSYVTRLVIVIVSGAVYYGITRLTGSGDFTLLSTAIAGLSPLAFYHVVVEAYNKPKVTAKKKK